MKNYIQKVELRYSQETFEKLEGKKDGTQNDKWVSSGHATSKQVQFQKEGVEKIEEYIIKKTISERFQKDMTFFYQKTHQVPSKGDEK